MNKYCDIIDAVITYLEGVFRSLKGFKGFEPTLILRTSDKYVSSKSVSKVIFIVLLMFNHKKTKNRVLFKIVEGTK